jgi:hypothetical protein
VATRTYENRVTAVAESRNPKAKCVSKKYSAKQRKRYCGRRS